MNTPKPNVLVIDDEERICKLVQHFLRESELFDQIVTAENVFTGLQKFQNQSFDLVIIDYVMPNQKGTEFIEALRRSIRYRNTKIILVSGYLSKTAMAEVIRHGVRNILVKPFDKAKLIQTVCQLLKIDPRKAKNL